MGRKKVRNLSRLARIALFHSCQISGYHLDLLPKDDKGAPVPVNGVYWSLSHKSDVVGAVAAPLPVGLDLEIIRPVNPLMMAKVADDREWDLLGEESLKNFFRLWTAKEATLKAVGRGIAGLAACKVAGIVDDGQMVLDVDGRCWTVDHYWFDDHVAALTVYDFQVNWSKVD
jgi:4'-phosphopantetheinyl transferase